MNAEAVSLLSEEVIRLKSENERLRGGLTVAKAALEQLRSTNEITTTQLKEIRNELLELYNPFVAAIASLDAISMALGLEPLDDKQAQGKAISAAIAELFDAAAAKFR